MWNIILSAMITKNFMVVSGLASIVGAILTGIDLIQINGIIQLALFILMLFSFVIYLKLQLKSQKKKLENEKQIEIDKYVLYYEELYKLTAGN